MKDIFLIAEDFKDGSGANLKLPDPELVRIYELLDKRIIWIDDEITDSTLNVVDYILKWNAADSDIPVEDRKPIRFFFQSPGGSLDIEEAIVSIIEVSKTPIIGIAVGMVASAASLIFLSCHKRYALKSAYWIFHRGGVSNVSGEYKNVKNMMRDYDEQIEKMEEFYIEHTNFSKEEIKENMESDWYIRTEEALKRNIIHDIISKDNFDILL